ncbi:hypothetical protein COMNV_01625 [Commensalibacter sp. Nvir]|uniref:hypothetical protein n=1 Tax=Commensalibacter sp. Nvir TaxID=3069817 RepID=UPI002D5EAB21|nr:hypothetical protein COMNV_01625 [Commensalibacter sp. Nvir]
MRLKTCHGTALYHDEDGMVVNAIEEHGIHSGLGIVDAYIYPSTPNIITLRSRNNPNLRLKFIDYVPNHNGLMLKITKSRDAKITLSRLYRQANYYACFLPPNPLRGGIEANCLEAKGFEQIALEYLYDDNTILEPSLPFVFGNDTTLEEVTGWVSSSSGDIRDQFLRVMLSVSVSVRNHMCEHIVPGLLWPFI